MFRARLAGSCRNAWSTFAWARLKTDCSLLFVSRASRIASQGCPPHADTRSGIDASWLVCRRADYAPRLRSSPRLAQNALVYYYFSSFLLSCQLPCCNSLWAFSAISRLRLLRDELAHIGVEILLGGDTIIPTDTWHGVGATLCLHLRRHRAACPLVCAF